MRTFLSSSYQIIKMTKVEERSIFHHVSLTGKGEVRVSRQRVWEDHQLQDSRNSHGMVTVLFINTCIHIHPDVSSSALLVKRNTVEVRSSQASHNGRECRANFRLSGISLNRSFSGGVMIVEHTKEEWEKKEKQEFGVQVLSDFTESEINTDTVYIQSGRGWVGWACSTYLRGRERF